MCSNRVQCYKKILIWTKNVAFIVNKCVLLLYIHLNWTWRSRNRAVFIDLSTECSLFLFQQICVFTLETIVPKGMNLDLKCRVHCKNVHKFYKFKYMYCSVVGNRNVLFRI